MRRLETVEAQWLIQQPFTSPAWVIEDLLTAGLSLLVGSPKSGKSWMALKMALCVSTGTPFWDLKTQECDVLYLCLEDTKTRVQQRLWKLTEEASPRLHLATSAEKITGDLIPQLEEFVSEHPDTHMMIVDTLQMARKASGGNAYAADYSDTNALKKYADGHGIAILCIHHSRKMGDSDVFNTVSGTNGITGAADCTMVLSNLNRSAHRATLSVTGRDVEFQEYKIRMDDCVWELVEKTSREELEEREVPDDVLRVLDFMMTRPVEWKGTTTELYTELRLEGVSVPAFGKRLAQNRDFMAGRALCSSVCAPAREASLVSARRSLSVTGVAAVAGSQI